MTVIEDILAERKAQDEKWGPQNHPDVRVGLMEREGGCSPERMADEYEIPTASRARTSCQIEAGRGHLTWTDIVVEELAEAVEAAALGSVEDLRTELVQTAACFVAWIEAIDRRRPLAPPPGPGDAGYRFTR